MDQLILDFGTVALIVTADENDDSLDIGTIEAANPNDNGVDASHPGPWSDIIGKPFSWGWLTVNQQGYCDGMLLSFEGAIPQILLNVLTSSIKVGSVVMSHIVEERSGSRL